MFPTALPCVLNNWAIIINNFSPLLMSTLINGSVLAEPSLIVCTYRVLGTLIGSKIWKECFRKKPKPCDSEIYWYNTDVHLGNTGM